MENTNGKQAAKFFELTTEGIGQGTEDFRSSERHRKIVGKTVPFIVGKNEEFSD